MSPSGEALRRIGKSCPMCVIPGSHHCLRPSRTRAILMMSTQKGRDLFMEAASGELICGEQIHDGTHVGYRRRNHTKRRGGNEWLQETQATAFSRLHGARYLEDWGISLQGTSPTYSIVNGRVNRSPKCTERRTESYSTLASSTRQVPDKMSFPASGGSYAVHFQDWNQETRRGTPSRGVISHGRITCGGSVGNGATTKTGRRLYPTRTSGPCMVMSTVRIVQREVTTRMCEQIKRYRYNHRSLQEHWR